MRKIHPKAEQIQQSLQNNLKSPREIENELSDYTFNNFSSSDLSETRVKSVYNDTEARLIKERRQQRRHYPGRSIESIKSYPHKKSLDMTLSTGNVSIITDNILLGSRNDAGDLPLLLKLGVTHILNVAQQLPIYYPTHFLYLKIPIIDSAETNIVECMQSVMLFLSHVEAVKGRVLIHCISGTRCDA